SLRGGLRHGARRRTGPDAAREPCEPREGGNSRLACVENWRHARPVVATRRDRGRRRMRLAVSLLARALVWAAAGALILSAVVLTGCGSSNSARSGLAKITADQKELQTLDARAADFQRGESPVSDAEAIAA